MANSPQARKRARQATKRHVHNASLRSKMRTFIKYVQKAVLKKDHATAALQYKRAVAILDSLANKGLIHKNKAARHKSRLNNHIKNIAPTV